MSAPQASHVIQRSRLNIRVAQEKHAHDIQNLVVQTFQAEVMPLLEQEFDRWIPADQVIQVDRLELNLGSIPLSNLQEALPRLIGDRLRALLPQVVSGSGQDLADVKLMQQSSESSQLEYLVHFLKTGSLGWEHGSDGAAPRQWLRQLLESAPIALRNSLASILQNPRVTQRLCLQFEASQVAEVLRLMIGDAAVSARVMGLLKETTGQFARLAQLLSTLPSSSSGQWAALASPLLQNWEKLPQGAAMISSPSDLVRLTVRSLVEAGRLSWAGLESHLELQEPPVLFRVLKLLAPGTELAMDTEPVSQVAMDASAQPLRRLVMLHFQEPGGISDKVWAEIVSAAVPASPQGLQDQVIGLVRLGSSVHAIEGQISKTQPVDSISTPNGMPNVVTEKPQLSDGSRLRDHGRTSNERPSLFANDAGIYVQNAGLVLLNPFLQPCFEDLGWMEHGDFINEEAHEDAVLFTAYLASGEEEITEPRLPLAKLLCGMDIGQPVRMELNLPDRALAEADTLLTAANEHWKRAGKLSPAQFRKAFLVREGRLETQGAGWNIKVDRHTIDILLEFLPWSFGTIKLPWMDGLLTVDW